jgi:hypothetical protein
VPVGGAKVLLPIGAVSSTKRPTSIVFLALLFFPAALIWRWASPIYVKDGEYARPAGAGRKLRHAAVIVGTWGLLVLGLFLLRPATIYQLPQCQDPVTVAILGAAVQDSPSSRLVNSEILEVTDLVEIGWSE